MKHRIGIENPVTRFAPSPTGHLHLGHVANAVYVWGIARAIGAKVILRIEDHDRTRCRPEYEASILEDLEWLGLEPDLAPASAFRAGPCSYRQSDCDAQYREALVRLETTAGVYACDCSRKVLAARIGAGNGELRYDGYCRTRSVAHKASASLRLPLSPESVDFDALLLGPQCQEPYRQCGDLVLRDRHGCWTYQFAVTVDDWLQGVNLILRGQDLLDSTGRQIQLARMLGRDTPVRFLHHPLIAGAEGRKLSKREFAKGIRDLRAEGVSPEAVLGEAAWRTGLLPTFQPVAAGELAALFASGVPLRESGTQEPA